MTRLLRTASALTAALLLIALPVTAQDPETPKPGSVVVMAAVWDGATLVPLDQYLIVPPLACDPA